MSWFHRGTAYVWPSGADEWHQSGSDRYWPLLFVFKHTGYGCVKVIDWSLYTVQPTAWDFLGNGQFWSQFKRQFKKNVSDHRRFPPEVWDQQQTPVVFLIICICFKTVLLGLPSSVSLEFGWYASSWIFQSMCLEMHPAKTFTKHRVFTQRWHQTWADIWDRLTEAVLNQSSCPHVQKCLVFF